MVLDPANLTLHSLFIHIFFFFHFYRKTIYHYLWKLLKNYNKQTFSRNWSAQDQWGKNRTGTKWGLKTGPAPSGSKKRQAPQGRLNCCRPILKSGPIKGLNFTHFSSLLHFCSSNNELFMKVWKKWWWPCSSKLLANFRK